MNSRAIHNICRLLPALAGLLLASPLATAEEHPEKSPGTVKVAGIVLKWIRTDKEANLRRIEPMIRRAAARGARIICTTECFLDGYAIADKSIPLETYRALGERIPEGPYFRRLAALAGELDIFLIAGMLEAVGEKRYNTAVIINPDGKLTGKYHKQKLGHELERNTPGEESPVFEVPWGRVGVMICADRTEESIVRRFSEGGAGFLICPSGGMYGPARNDPIVQARSRENGKFIVFVHPAEFLVTGPDGTIRSRTILGDRLLIAPDEEGGQRDRNGIFYFDLPTFPREKRSLPEKVDLSRDLDIAGALAEPILEPGTARADVKEFLESRIPHVTPRPTREAWERYAARLRRQILERVVLRGEAKRWSEAETRVEWLETMDGGPGYKIKKLRFEALPGLWVPALLYEPEELTGKVPVVLNVNGHEGIGKRVPYKQIRCINQAKRGMLALNVEWLGMGQLGTAGYHHYRMNQLDLCGTSGLAPFYLSMKRSLDLLLSLEHADPERVAVAGLSGGGWQTIIISSLDERVKLANPVAGYGSFRDRIHHPEDLGDSEQTPVDLASLADYTHLTALLAPRASLLTYNAEDNCCFKAAHALPPLLDAARPVFQLYGREDALRSHVNHDPGTHNFDRENREVLYRMLGDFFQVGAPHFRLDEIHSTDEVKSEEQLQVELPEDNADFHTLALDLSRSLPRDAALPEDRDAARSWQNVRRKSLGRLVRRKSYGVRVETTAREKYADGTVTLRALSLDGVWTLPAVEIARGTPETTVNRAVILLADRGRKSAAVEVKSLMDAGHRVLALDPFHLGESALGHGDRDHLIALLVASVGDRPLGIQASQLAAVARWLKTSHAGTTVKIRAIGQRSSLMALVAAALEEEAIDSIELAGSFASLREIIERNLAVNQAPELFSFGLLEEFDVLQLCALVAPRPVRFLEPIGKTRTVLAGLSGWYERLGSSFDPWKP